MSDCRKPAGPPPAEAPVAEPCCVLAFNGLLPGAAAVLAWLPWRGVFCMAAPAMNDRKATDATAINEMSHWNSVAVTVTPIEMWALGAIRHHRPIMRWKTSFTVAHTWHERRSEAKSKRIFDRRTSVFL